MECHTYILECNDGSYYVGSTKYLTLRMAQHQQGEGSKWTANRLPVRLVYAEAFTRIDFAFRREHQLKKWSRRKKAALITGTEQALRSAAICQNASRIVGVATLEAEQRQLLLDEDHERNTLQNRL